MALGDENTLAGTTRAHKHTAPSSDGGFLQTTDTGVTNMSEGSMGYYDSSSVLQEMSISSASDQLRVNGAGTAPEWFTPSGGGATLTRNTAVLATAQTTSSTSMIDINSMSLVLESGVGNCICLFQTTSQGSQNGFLGWDWSTDGASTILRCDYNYNMQTLTAISDTLSGQTAVAQMKRAGASGDFTVSINNENSVAYWLQIS